MFFSAQDKGEMAAMCHNWPQDDLEAIVVTGEHAALLEHSQGCPHSTNLLHMLVLGAQHWRSRCHAACADVACIKDAIRWS